MTKVCFRKATYDNGQTEIVAVFPEIPWNDFFLTSYTNVGQHGACAPEWVRKDTIPAKPDEYFPLMTELQNLVGYNDLVVLQDMPRS